MPLRSALAATITFSSVALPANAQTDAPVGVRAQGMAGAFVAVSDDASAVFWNPAGLASGSYFSLVVERNSTETDDVPFPRSSSSFIFALGTPPFGLTYYRTRTTRLLGALDSSDGRAESLIAHHTGATLVQTVAPGVAIGATVKLVRGIAASAASGVFDLDAAEDLVGRASNRFDVDIGIMTVSRGIKAGVTARNLFEPEFPTSRDTERIRLERRIRAGVAVPIVGAIVLAADADLTKVSVAAGKWRDAAAGAEARLSGRAWARSGIHWNTAGGPIGVAPVGSVGGSYAVLGAFLVDAQVSFGSREGERGWGLGARVVF